MVETSWAKTFVRVSGPPAAPLMVLMHGAATNSVSWEANVEALSKDYRTYAVDNPYDIGRSVYTRDAKTAADYVSWMEELFTALDLGDQINLVGMSYGAWLTSMYVLRHPTRVKRAVLLSPALVVAFVRFVWVVRCLLSMLNRSLSRNFANWTLHDAKNKDAYCKQLVEEVSSDALMMSKMCVPRTAVIPTKLTDEELRSIQVPMLILAGEHEKIYHPHKAVRRVNRVAPHIKMEVIPGAGHDLPLAQKETVNQKVLEFLR
jgi:pimeloyl-ACP methyl ester carboxylesterase